MIFKSSKPTQAQGLCGLAHCYVDARTGALGKMNNEIIIKEEKLTAEEYIDFLKRSDLGSQYPKERFYERIYKLVKKCINKSCG